MIPHVVGWMSLPNVLALDVLVVRMLQNATPDSDEEVKPMTYSERIAWLCETPDSMLTAEELQVREDNEMLAAFGLARPKVSDGIG